MIQYGVAGWSYDDWVGPVYPRRKPKGFHPLSYLAQFIDLMELNSSFYALPRPDHAARWVELLEPFPDFRLTAKLHQGFTHGGLEDVRADAAAAFRLGLSPLVEAGRLLALLAIRALNTARGNGRLAHRMGAPLAVNGVGELQVAVG